jgi:uroporphyrinogen decarboxylase
MNSMQLAFDTILQKSTTGIPDWEILVMEHSQLERVAKVQSGEYKRNPEQTYLSFIKSIGTCLLDQYLPFNPLSIEPEGFKDTEKTATTGAEHVVLDGMIIDSPEAVAEHMEKFLFPSLRTQIREFNEPQRIKEIIDGEKDVQDKLSPVTLKSGYGFITFPNLLYYVYGYVNYFMAYALYPELMMKSFELQTELSVLNNKAVAKIYQQGLLPPLFRLDHDLTDSRGPLVSIDSLDKMWFPLLERSLAPLLDTGLKMIWHCDGNITSFVPRLLEIGIKGFQGAQYEDGVDYEKICKLKAKDGDNLIIIAGISVTRTLPKGTPADIKKEFKWLVEHGPRTGMFFGGTSSITPGVPWENIETFIEGLKYYREHGRS